MKRFLLLLLTAFPYLLLQAQPAIKDKKYPSLLWEITGNGMKKPSYLIGTMHVSSKLAFHLPDSFYIAIRNAQVVALETNPETWQEDMSKYDLGDESYPGSNYRFGNYISVPGEYMTINTLKFYKYDKKIERSLYSNPSTINNLLYRSYGNKSSDFEEDTYLDMYIFQCGKKWGKKVTGVENYGESMRLMAEAYKDAAKDRNKKKEAMTGKKIIPRINCRKPIAVVTWTCWIPLTNTIVFHRPLMKNFCTGGMRYRPIPWILFYDPEKPCS